MKTLRLFANLTVGCAIGMLAGCGGGTGGGSAPGIAGGRGAIRIGVHWPSATRVVPRVSQAVTIVAMAGDPPVQVGIPVTVKKSTDDIGFGNPALIKDLPSGLVTLTATAYPQPDGSGVAQARVANVPVTVKAASTVDVVLTLATTIHDIKLSGPTHVAKGATFTVIASPVDDAGRVVLVDPSTITLASVPAGVFEIVKANLSFNLTATASGSFNLAAAYAERGGHAATLPTSQLTINVSSSPTFFVSDSGNKRIVGLDTIPATSFIPYDDSAFGAAFYSPQSVALDAQGRIYIDDYLPGASRIVRIDDTSGKNRQVYTPANPTSSIVYVDPHLGQGRIYYRTDNGAINRIDDISGANLVSFGGGVNNMAGLLGNPSGIAVDSKHRIYVFDGSSQLIRFDDMTGKNLVKLGSHGSGTNQFNVNVSFGGGVIAIDSADHIYISDSDNHRIVRIDADDALSGKNWTVYNVPKFQNQPVRPLTVSVDGTTTPTHIPTHIYFVDNVNGSIYRMDNMAGEGLRDYGSTGTGSGQFTFPQNVAAK